MPKRAAKKRLGTPVAKWLWGESDGLTTETTNPFREPGELDEIQDQARRAAQATDAARQERQASLGRDASHDGE